MNATVLGAALATGLVGSLHCPLMCGPLALASGAPVRYLAGRLVSYAGLGAAFGLLGEHALCRLPVATVQLGAMLLVGVFAFAQGWKALRGPGPRLVPIRPRAPGRLARLWGRALTLIPRRGVGLGLATGFLPCGMLVPAWLLAGTSGDAASGALVMAIFWAATTPALVLPVLTRGLLRRIPVRVQAVAWCALGVWIAVRPLLMAAHRHP